MTAIAGAGGMTARWAAVLGLALAACGDDGATGDGAGGGTTAIATGAGGVTTSTTTSASASTTTAGGGGASEGGGPSTAGGGGDSAEGGGGSAEGGGGASPACDGAPAGPGDVEHTLRWDGDDRTFRVHLPPGYPAAAPYPVVLMFHGYLEDGDQFETISQMTPAADARGVVVVYGDGRSSSWNAGSCCGSSATFDVDDVGLVGAMLDALIPTYCLDDRRVYAAGFSNGGMLSHRLACEMSDRITAIGPTAGTLAVDTCAPTRAVPVLHTHGTDDFVVPWGGGGFANAAPVDDTIATWRAQGGCADGDPRTVYENGDATCVAWTGCDDGAEVRLCTIEGGGHQWPGGESAGPGGTLSEDLETSEVLLDFFLGFALP